MLMDKMTEMVAHMIGIFHTTLEEERMRDVYDKFKALQAADPEIDPLEAMGITFEATYKLDGFAPALRYSDTVSSDPTSDLASPFYANAVYPVYLPPATVGAATETLTFYTQAMGLGRALLTLEPPSSVVIVTSQSAFLTDNDLILLGSGDTVFTDPLEFLDQLQQYQTVAEAIAAPVDAEMIIAGDTAAQDAIALQERLSSADAATLTGVSAQMHHGEDAAGIHVNGLEVEEMPELDDLWPAFKSDNAADTDEEAEDGDTAEDETGEAYDWPDPFEGLSSGDGDGGLADIDAGHEVVTGANTLVNEVLISTAWLDAPVFSVMGDVVNLTAISQINILVDHDYGTFGEFVASTVMNAASVSATVTTPVPEEGEEDGADSDGAANLGLPLNWAVTRIDGDLICVNQVSQYSFVTDNDRAEITFSSTNTYIGMGDNTVLNLTDLSELGFGYDLIMIGGSMISVNWISQLNIMIDNDTVTYSGDTPDGFSGSDNLLFNAAMINSVGVDSYTEMQDNFAAASEDFANGALTIDKSVAHDSVFEGTEILKVLYIDGDLTTINWIEQTNVLGDSDQVHLALGDLEAETGASATVTTGSNSTINSAIINDYGVDSSVAVNGEVYDDALLYQAELIDTDADPLGVDMPALVNEAVAFLADDMMGPDIGPADETITPTTPETTTTPDVMQSMLA